MTENIMRLVCWDSLRVDMRSHRHFWLSVKYKEKSHLIQVYRPDLVEANGPHGIG